MDEGRLGIVIRQEEQHRKFVYMMNDIVRARLGLITNCLDREQHETSMKLVKNCSDMRRAVVRQRVLRQCLEMRKRKIHQRDPYGQYGQYGGKPLYALTRDIDQVIADNHPKVRRMKRVEQTLQRSLESGAILDEAAMARRVDALFQLKHRKKDLDRERGGGGGGREVFKGPVLKRQSFPKPPVSVSYAENGTKGAATESPGQGGGGGGLSKQRSLTPGGHFTPQAPRVKSDSPHHHGNNNNNNASKETTRKISTKETPSTELSTTTTTTKHPPTSKPHPGKDFSTQELRSQEETQPTSQQAPAGKDNSQQLTRPSDPSGVTSKVALDVDPKGKLRGIITTPILVESSLEEEEEARGETKSPGDNSGKSKKSPEAAGDTEKNESKDDAGDAERSERVKPEHKESTTNKNGHLQKAEREREARTPGGGGGGGGGDDECDDVGGGDIKEEDEKVVRRGSNGRQGSREVVSRERSKLILPPIQTSKDLVTRR